MKRLVKGPMCHIKLSCHILVKVPDPKRISRVVMSVSRLASGSYSLMFYLSFTREHGLPFGFFSLTEIHSRINSLTIQWLFKRLVWCNVCDFRQSEVQMKLVFYIWYPFFL